MLEWLIRKLVRRMLNKRSSYYAMIPLMKIIHEEVCRRYYEETVGSANHFIMDCLEMGTRKKKND